MNDANQECEGCNNSIAQRASDRPPVKKALREDAQTATTPAEADRLHAAEVTA
jgi:hypothetical protein